MTWKCYVKDSVSYAAMTDETAALAYRVEWALNTPAVATILVNDDSGAKTQTYGTGYLGTSALLLEQPATTEIFRGRLVASEPNPEAGTLTLTGEDWLSQLNDRRVIYDTRANLGNGYREAPAARITATTGSTGENTAWGVTGVTPILINPSAGILGAWANDQWNGYRLVLPTTHLGQQTETLEAYAETVTVNVGAPDTDTPASGYLNVHLADTNVHRVVNTDAADSGFYIVYTFRSLAARDLGGLVASLDALRVTVVAKFYGVATTTSNVALYHTGYGAYVDQSFRTGLPDAYARTFTITASSAPSNYFDANGDLLVRFIVYGAAGTTDLDVDRVTVELDYTIDTALTTTYGIVDTVNNGDGAGTYDYVTLGDSPRTAGAVSDWQYSFTQLATVYVADLVTTYDELYALNASSNVTASTHYVARHYHRQSPLQILKDLAAVDGTQFWLDGWDGDSLDLHWNDAFGGAAVATWTDASVLAWASSGYQLKEVINECFVEGYAFGDQKIQDDYIDAGGSVAAYGQRSKYIQNSDIGRNDEALAEATNVVTRLKDPRLLLSGTLNGYSTVLLGDIVTVTSTKFNLNTDYVVIRKVYDSQSATTTFDLTPKTTLLTIRPPLTQLLQRLDDRLVSLETTMERTDRYTDVWT